MRFLEGLKNALTAFNNIGTGSKDDPISPNPIHDIGRLDGMDVKFASEKEKRSWFDATGRCQFTIDKEGSIQPYPYPDGLPGCRSYGVYPNQGKDLVTVYETNYEYDQEGYSTLDLGVFGASTAVIGAIFGGMVTGAVTACCKGVSSIIGSYRERREANRQQSAVENQTRRINAQIERQFELSQSVGGYVPYVPPAQRSPVIERQDVVAPQTRTIQLGLEDTV
jgi:hypothetical protein